MINETLTDNEYIGSRWYYPHLKEQYEMKVCPPAGERTCMPPQTPTCQHNTMYEAIT